MDTDIQQLKTTAEAAKLAAQNAANAAEKAAQVASDASVNAAVVNVNIEFIKKDITEIKETLKTQGNSFVGLEEWKIHLTRDEDHETRIRIVERITEGVPLIQRLVYGGVALILVSVVTAIIYLVIKR